MTKLNRILVMPRAIAGTILSFIDADKKNIVCMSLFLMFAWLPFYITFYPGVGMHDEIYCAQNLIGLNNQPFIYCVYLNIFYKIGRMLNSYTLGMGLCVFSMMLVMAFTIAVVISWIYNMQRSKLTCLILLLYYAFTPIVIDYAIAAVKDKMFAVILLALIPVLCRLAQKTLVYDSSVMWVMFFFLSVCMMWVRNNGLHIFVGILVIMLLLRRNGRRSMLKVALICLVLVYLPSAYVHKITKANFTEAIGIPLQQVCRVVALKRTISIDDLNYINNIMQTKQIEQKYNKDSIDTIKWSPLFNRKFLDTHKKQFIRVWFDLGKKYPYDYIKAWIYMTRGFWWYLPWNAGQSKFGHAYEDSIYLADNKVGMADGYKISDLDLLPESVKRVLGHYVWDNSIFIPSGPCLWLTILICFLLFLRKRKLYIIALLPAILCSGTLILATPISNCFRYTFYYALCLPIYMFLPFIHGLETEIKK